MNYLPLNLGYLSATDMGAAVARFIDEARTVRALLCSHGALLDQWMQYVLVAANDITSEEAAADGFNAGSHLYRLCKSIANGSNILSDHPFYETAAAYIKANPIPETDKHVSGWVYFVQLFGRYMERAVAEYIQERRISARNIAAPETLTELERSIAVILDHDRDGHFAAMKRSYQECFGSAPIVVAYMNGALFQLSEALMDKNHATMRYVYQILMDNPMPPV